MISLPRIRSYRQGNEGHLMLVMYFRCQDGRSAKVWSNASLPALCHLQVRKMMRAEIRDTARRFARKNGTEAVV